MKALYVFERRVRLSPRLFIDILSSPAGWFWEITEQNLNQYCTLLDGGYYDCPDQCAAAALAEVHDLGFRAAA